MILSLFNHRRRAQAIEPLYGAMMANALKPALFEAGQIPDTFEGRFESVTLHAALLLRRLKALPSPANEAAQELVDRVFDGVDAAMREVGISDVGVPKRIKKFAQGFYGRLAAYEQALAAEAGPQLLADVLSRNVLEGATSPAYLVDYVRATDVALQGATFEELISGQWPVGITGAAHG